MHLLSSQRACQARLWVPVGPLQEPGLRRPLQSHQDPLGSDSGRPSLRATGPLESLPQRPCHLPWLTVQLVPTAWFRSHVDNRACGTGTPWPRSAASAKSSLYAPGATLTSHRPAPPHLGPAVGPLCLSRLRRGRKPGAWLEDASPQSLPVVTCLVLCWCRTSLLLQGHQSWARAPPNPHPSSGREHVPSTVLVTGPGHADVG